MNELYDLNQDFSEVDTSLQLMLERDHAEMMQIFERAQLLLNICDNAINHHSFPVELVESIGKSDLESEGGITLPEYSAETHDEYVQIATEGLIDAIASMIQKINYHIGRISDKIVNKFKTILPFKERYMKIIATAKKDGIFTKPVNMEKYNVATFHGFSKSVWKTNLAASKKFSSAIAAFANNVDAKTFEMLAKGAEGISDNNISAKQTMKESGFSVRDVETAGTEAIDLMMEISDIETYYIKIYQQMVRKTDAIQKQMAAGDDEKAKALRRELALLQTWYEAGAHLAIQYLASIRVFVKQAAAMSTNVRNSLK